MSVRRMVFQWWLGMGLLLLGSPGLAAAQSAVLYEVSETMKFDSRLAGQYRTATATLVGALRPGPSICPPWLVQMLKTTACGLVVTATSDVSLATGTGTVSGKFSVVVEGDNAVDGTEAQIVKGDVTGTIDLTLALRGLAPIATLTGTWTASGVPGLLHGLKTQGSLTGTFRLPYLAPTGCADDGNLSDCTAVYVVPEDPAGFQVIAPAEYSLGVPSVRLELRMTETPSTLTSP
jgi:hypothetical protein